MSVLAILAAAAMQFAPLAPSVDVDAVAARTVAAIDYAASPGERCSQGDARNAFQILGEIAYYAEFLDTEGNPLPDPEQDYVVARQGLIHMVAASAVPSVCTEVGK